MIQSARLWLCLVGLTLAVPAAPAQAQTTDVIADARLASVRPALERTLAAANADQLPSAWLRDKVAEGLAKHAPPGRIAQAVDALYRRMQAADAMERDLALRGADRPRALLRALVDALGAGAPAAGLAPLVQRVADATHSRETTRQAALTVAELAERQLTPTLALELASRAFRDHGQAGLTALRNTARGAAPGQLEAALRRAAASGNARGRTNGPALDHHMGPPGGPPHDNAFSQGRGRSESRGMRP